MYREEGKAKCPACQRIVAQVREFNMGTKSFDIPQVSRHLFQESTDTTEIGYPVLNADGFCPGSFSKVRE